MQLIAVLLAFSIERLVRLPPAWHLEFYLNRWQTWLAARDSETVTKLQGNVWGALLLGLIPALLVGLVLAVVGPGLIALIISVAAILLAMACQPQRSTYRGYLNAAHRGDAEQLDHHSQDLLSQEASSASQPLQTPAQALAWIHYRYYAAVLIIFVVFGAVGVLLYASLRELLKQTETAADQNAEHLATWQKVMWVGDWVPVRITTLGLLLVGHFSRALPVWLQSVMQPQQSAAAVLLSVAEAAEDKVEGEPDHTTHPTQMVALFKRNLLLLIVALALLTLSGWFY